MHPLNPVAHISSSLAMIRLETQVRFAGYNANIISLKILTIFSFWYSVLFGFHVKDKQFLVIDVQSREV